MQAVSTPGEHVAYGPEGQVVATFATEGDRRLFEAARHPILYLVIAGTTRTGRMAVLDVFPELSAATRRLDIVKDVWPDARIGLVIDHLPALGLRGGPEGDAGSL